MATCSHTFEKLKENLSVLRLECQDQSQVFREHIEGLLKIYRMILTHPSEAKYKTITVEKFESKWPRPSMKQVLMDAGWTAVDDVIVFTGSDTFVKEVMRTLSEARVNAVPNVSEWISDSKIERINYRIDQFDEAERRLRKAKAIERDQELAQFLVEKAEKMKIAENLRKEIRLDNEFKKSLTGPAKGAAVPLERPRPIERLANAGTFDNGRDQQQQPQLLRRR